MRIGTSEWKEVIVTGAGELGILVEEEQVDQFATHATTLITWNRKINLTTIVSPLEIAIKHFLDAIALVPHIRSANRLLDVGTGAGFPGIPLKVMLPHLAVILLDATLKKVHFLKHVLRQLNSHEITAIHARVEELNHRGMGPFDVIVSRAFSSLSDFVEKSLPLLSMDGLLVAYKSKDYKTEFDHDVIFKPVDGMKRVSSKFGNVQFNIELVHITLPYLDLPRTLILMHRVKQ